MVFAFLGMVHLYKNYRETKRAPTLYFLLCYIFFLIAGSLLIIEKLSFSTLGLPDLGVLMGIVALINVAIALVCGLRFVFLSTYPRHVNILNFLGAIVLAICFGTLIYAIITGPPNAHIQNYELIYSPIINFVVYITIVPLISIGTMPFYIYAFRMRNDDRPNFNRTFWLGTGVLIFLLGILAEIGPFFPSILSIPLRIAMLLGTIIMYICFTMPQWFKDRIGWKD